MRVEVFLKLVFGFYQSIFLELSFFGSVFRFFIHF